MDYPPASSNENHFTGGRWNSNIHSWHHVAVKLFQLLSVVDWDVNTRGSEDTGRSSILCI